MIIRPILTVMVGDILILKDENAIQSVESICKNEMRRNLNFDVVSIHNYPNKYKCFIETKKHPDIENLQYFGKVKIYSIIDFYCQSTSQNNLEKLPYFPVEDSVKVFFDENEVGFRLKGRDIVVNERVDTIRYRPIFVMSLMKASCKCHLGISTWKLEFEEL